MRSHTAISIALILLTAAVYAPVVGHGFVDYDDPAYISANPHVLAGLTAAGARWALTADVQASWGPLTQITLMAQAAVFGNHPAGYHAVDAACHALNAVLLFLLLAQMTGRTGRSAVVAALFAVHPMHVESVAWASEWKDVLSTALALGALLAYVRYCRGQRTGGPTVRWTGYAAMLVLATLSLLAKPMYVTLPGLLLLLDIWPLRRDATWSKLVAEKLPLIALSAAAALAAVVAQLRGGAVAATAALPLGDRLAHAAVSYWLYVFKLLVPADLAVFYPHPGHEPLAHVAVAVAGLAAVSAAVLALRKRPYLAVGWFWFLWMLVPVIGLVQIGAQSIADRYSYFPSIGLSVAAVWCIAQWTGPSRIGRTLAAAIALSAITALAVLARQQLTYWQDTATLFTHAAAVTDNNWVADLELGRVAASTDPAMAAGYYSDVVRLRPTDPRGYIGVADAIISKNPQAAQQQYAQAVHLQPRSAPLRLSYAAALDATGQPADALVQAREAIRLDPSLPAARAAEADLLRQLAHRPEHPPPQPTHAPAPQ